MFLISLAGWAEGGRARSSAVVRCRQERDVGRETGLGSGAWRLGGRLPVVFPRSVAFTCTFLIANNIVIFAASQALTTYLAEGWPVALPEGGGTLALASFKAQTSNDMGTSMHASTYSTQAFPLRLLNTVAEASPPRRTQ